MSRHDMAYTMAYTDLMSRRDYGTGSLFQRCEARYGCPPLVDGPPDPKTGKVSKVRPEHKCRGRWFGSVEAGFTADGTRRRITVSHAQKSVAQRRLRDKLLEVEQAGASNTRRTITVSKWAAEWLETLETKIRPNSLTTDRAAVRWINQTIGHKKLADLTPRDVRAVASALRADGKSTSTALRYHGPLIRMLKAAAVEGYMIPPNVLMATPPKAAVNDKQSIPVVDAVRLLHHLTKRDDSGKLLLPDSSRWSLSLLQGIRHGEAHGLCWDQVDFKRGEITICWQVQNLKYREKGNPGAGFVMPDGYEVVHIAGSAHLVRPKSSAGWRTMPLLPWAMSALAEWREIAPTNPLGIVWPGRTLTSRSKSAGTTWPRNKAADRVEWNEIQAAAGIRHPSGRPYGVHEIRHTTATLLMELKVPASVRVAIMGHSTIRSTRAYEHVDPEQIRSAFEGLGRLLELPEA